MQEIENKLFLKGANSGEHTITKKTGMLGLQLQAASQFPDIFFVNVSLRMHSQDNTKGL
mgnify:CR=1 FL=1